MFDGARVAMCSTDSRVASEQAQGRCGRWHTVDMVAGTEWMSPQARVDVAVDVPVGDQT